MKKAIEEITKKLEEIVTNELERFGIDMKTKSGRETKDYIMYDIVLPNAKDFVQRSVRDITQDLLWGTRYGKTTRYPRLHRTYNYYGYGQTTSNPYKFFRELSFDTEKEANEWLVDIRTCIDLLGEINVNEAARRATDWPRTKFYNGDMLGWTKLSEDLAACQSAEGNWYIPDFPDPERLDSSLDDTRDENTDDDEEE